MPSDSLRDAIGARLAKLAVPPEMIDDALALIPRNSVGVLVYGSRARGDYLDESDLDILVLSSGRRVSHHKGLASVSFYTLEQLETGIGTLFGAHLRRDAQIVFDPTGKLRQTVRGLGEVDASRLLTRVAHFSQVLGARDRDTPKYLPGLLREARYLLRSALYAMAIAEGRPCFSIRELASRNGDPMLSDLLTSRPAAEATEEELEACVQRLTAAVGPLPPNAHGSLEALIVNEWGRDDELVAMGLLALGGSNPDADYVEVGKVLL